MNGLGVFLLSSFCLAFAFITSTQEDEKKKEREKSEKWIFVSFFRFGSFFFSIVRGTGMYVVHLISIVDYEFSSARFSTVQ
jgi:hypothetical protein